MNITDHPRLEKLYRRFLMAYGRLRYGINGKKVVFSCFSGRSYGDNPKVISQRLHELCPDAQIVWLFKSNTIDREKKKLPPYVRAEVLNSRRAYIEHATARVWVDNFTKGNLFVPKKGKQFYVQTWHGDRPIKKIAFDAFPDTPWRVEQVADLILTGSDFAQKIYRTAFRYNGEFLNDGCPRNDILVKNDPADVLRVRKALGVANGTKLLLYAPTYREDKNIIGREEQMDLKRTLDTLEQKTGCPWLCLFRAHYLSAGIDLENVKDKIVDVSGYESMSELLLVTDLLLTDYSSSPMDFCVLNRPSVFFQADIAHYRDTRAFYFEPEDVPLFTAHNQDELDKLLMGLNEEKIRENCRAMREFFGMNETGHATDSVCRYIIDKLETK